MSQSNAENKTLTIIQAFLKHAEYFIDRNNLTLAIQHVKVILVSASKEYLGKDIIQSIINFLIQRETTPSFYGNLLLETKIREAYELFEKALKIAEKYQLTTEALALQSEIGSLLTEGVPLEATVQKNEDRQPQYRSAFNNLHAVLRGHLKQGATLEILIPIIYNINNLEARYYYSILKEFIADALKIYSSKKINFLSDIQPFFKRIDFVGQRLIVNDLTEKAWDLYATTQPFMPAELDAIFLERFSIIGANIIQRPGLPALPEEKKFATRIPFLADYLKQIPVCAEWQKYVIELTNMRCHRFPKKASDDLSETTEVDIFNRQKLFADDIKELVSIMITDAMHIIGLPPEIKEEQRIRFCLLALGSIANKSPTPYSDLEFAFLIQDVPDLSFSIQRNIKEYFERLLRLFEFMVASLGEYSPAGLHFDKEGHPLSESRLYGTTEQLIVATQQPIAPTAFDPLSYSLFHADHLFGDYKLLDEFKQKRHAYLRSISFNQEEPVHKLIARGFLNLHIKEFDDFVLRPGHYFDIKKPMVTSLNYIILDLALYYLAELDSDYNFTFNDALARLESTCKLSTNFSKLCQETMQVFQVNRVQAQLTNQQQLEIFSFPQTTKRLEAQKQELDRLKASSCSSLTEENNSLFVAMGSLINRAFEQIEQYHQYGVEAPEEIFELLSCLPNRRTSESVNKIKQEIEKLNIFLENNSSDLEKYSLALRLTDLQFQRIYSLYQGVLLPLHWAAKYFYNNGVFVTDPAKGMFAKSIEQYRSKENPLSSQDLRINLKSLVYYLALLKVSPNQYYRYLALLEESLYEYFFRIVEEAETTVNNDSTRLNHILPLLRYYPYETGRRKQVEINTGLWFENLRKLLSTNTLNTNLSIFVQGITQPAEDASKIEGYLHEGILNQIPKEFFSDDNSHKICRIIYRGKYFYLKREVQSSAVEYAANLYSAYFIGDDYVHSELTCWTVKDENNNIIRSYAVTIFDGDNNDLTFIRDEPKYHTLHYDHKAYSLAFLLELLITPDTRTTDYYYSREQKNGDEIIRTPAPLNNEFAFSCSGRRVDTLPGRAGHFFLQLNPVLLIQPEFLLSIHPDAKNEFLRLDVGRVLCEIFLLLATQYKGFLEIFGKKDGKDIQRWIVGEQKESSTYFLSPNFITHQYNTIIYIQRILKEQSEITHQQLLHLILPTVAYYNEFIRAKPLPDSFASFIRLVTEPLQYNIAEIVSYSEGRSSPLTKSPSHEILSTFLDEETVRTYLKPREALAELSFLQADSGLLELASVGVTKGIFSSYDKLALPASRDSVLAGVNYSGYEKKHYPALLQAIAKTEHFELVLLNLEHLADRDLLKILSNSPKLRVLKISGCINLSVSCMQTIASKCPLLQELDISDMSNWNSIELQSPLNNLRLINLTNCSKLKNFEINAPNALFFYANQCEQLIICNLRSQQLVKVTLNYCSSLPSKALIRLIRLSTRSLTILDITGCDTFDYLNLRSQYLELNYAEYIPEKFAIALSSIDSKEMDLSDCELTEYHLLTLKKFLNLIDYTVSVLNLSGCSFTLGAEQLLAETVLSGAGVLKLVLDRAFFPYPIYECINKILKDGFVLHSLSLSALNIDDQGIHTIIPFLQNNLFLFELNLSKNRISDEGINELTTAVQGTIGCLDLSDNNITAKGMENLFSYLETTDCSLINLDLHGNGDNQADELAVLQKWVPVVEKNKSLTSCMLIADNDKNEELSSPIGRPSSRRPSIMFRSVRNGNAKGSFFRTNQNCFTKNDTKLVDKTNAPFIEKNQELCNQLHSAMAENDLTRVKYLVDQGVSFLARNMYRRTALFEAVVVGQKEMLLYFLSKNPNINIINVYKQTPLQLAKRQDINDLLRNYLEFRKKQQQDNNKKLNFPLMYRIGIFYRATELTNDYLNAIKEGELKDSIDDENRAIDPMAEYKITQGTIVGEFPYFCMA